MQNPKLTISELYLTIVNLQEKQLIIMQIFR